MVIYVFNWQTQIIVRDYIVWGNRLMHYGKSPNNQFDKCVLLVYHIALS